MSSKEELYKVLLETAPYGTLFFVYGVCIDCNPKALGFFGCEKSQLVGTSLDEISGDETPALVEFKLRIKQAIKANEERIHWSLRGIDGTETSLMLNLQRVGDDDKEFIVTLIESSSTSPKPLLEEEYSVDSERKTDKSKVGCTWR